ncbi:MAG: histidine phosphatase family protein [Myxococcota bacterium]
MDILLVRHGESEGNRDHKLQGSSDKPLTDKGRGQARQLGRWLRERGARVDAAYCSPLRRAAETAAIVADAADFPAPTPLASAVEIHAGSLEDLGREEIVARHPDFMGRRLSSLGDFSAYGGESHDDVMKRVQRTTAFLSEHHRDAAERVLLVAHGGFNFHFAKALLCEPVPRLNMLRWGNCTATLIRMRERRGQFIGELNWHIPVELMAAPSDIVAAGALFP